MTSRFLDACRRRPTDVRPVWFMRQAGRYLKQYRDIRSKFTMLEMCTRPDIASQITLQPIEILDVDAAIIFADLLLPVIPMGLKLAYATGEGPIIDNPVRTTEDVDNLSTHNTDDLGYVGEAIQMTTRALNGRVPVIGFVGAPFTMASYMVEGSSTRNFIHTKRLMYSDETLWRRLMGKIVDVLAPFAAQQVATGARCIQVFDSWVGALGADDYVRYAAPYSRALIERIRSNGVPVIHFGTGASISTRRGWISATAPPSRGTSILSCSSLRFPNSKNVCTNFSAVPVRGPATFLTWAMASCPKLRWIM